MKVRNVLSDVVTRVIEVVGSVAAVMLAAVLLAAWLVVGAVSGFGGHWVDVLHAVAGATTFLMVFLLRHGEGREARAMLVKLDELVAAVEGTNERVIGIEQRTLHEQERIEREGPAA